MQEDDEPYDAPMTARATRADWLIFLALGFMWGSSYLFIKLAVDDFGTFTLIAVRLLIGAAMLWVVVRASGTALPRQRRTYGHLIVMASINIVVPFTLITWAEQSVDSALAAILNSTVPLFVLVIAPAFLPEEPIRLNGVVGLAVGFAGIVLLVSPGLVDASGNPAGELALLGSSLAYAAGNVYNRRNVRGLAPLIPAVFQVTFALLIVGTLALVLERPWETATPDLQAWVSVAWLGILGSGLAYLAYFRLLSHWGATRTSLVAYLLPIVGIVLGYLVLQEPVDATLLAGTALVIAGVALVNGRWGRRRLFSPTPPVEPV
jgi:drug/metabolite transporter (DMT)-like permease